MDSFIVVVIDIIFYRRPGFGHRVIQIRPNIFLLDRPNHPLNISIVIGSIVAGIRFGACKKREERYYTALAIGRDLLRFEALK